MGPARERRGHEVRLSLFEHVVAGPLRLRNRIAFPATIGNLGRDGAATDEQAAYYERRARGGAGLLVTEGVSVHSSSLPNPDVVKAYDPKSRAGLEKIAAASHKHGVPILLQLWHVGRQQLWGPTRSPWGVSSLPDAYSGVVPHVMTPGEIEDVERGFVECARTARDLGYDGIELHGAHGYLVTQFLSPWSNDRTDAYGGSFENRMRFARNVLGGIRAACGKDFAICVKLSGNEFVEGGLTEDDTRGIVADLAARGLADIFAISQGNFSLNLDTHAPDMHFPQAPFAEIIARVRPPGAEVKIMAIGRVLDREVAERLVADGTADLLGMARALISEPDLPRLWERGDDDHARRCISCNLCWGIIVGGKRVACIHNPETGDELRFRPPAKAASPRDVQVVGAGPAGMEAAWLAASRGHRVTLWEASDELGGQVRVLAALPGLAEYGEILRFQRARLDEHGVEIRLGETVTHERVAQWKDCEIVVATGSRPQAPPAHMRDARPLAPDDVLGVARAPDGARALVFDEDGGYASYGSVELLVRRGYAVTLATSRMEIAGALDYLSKLGLQRRLRNANVEIVPCVEPVARGREIALRDRYSGRERALDRIAVTVWAGPRAARDDLARGRANARVHVIGDAVSPRRIIAAIHEGNALGARL